MIMLWSGSSLASPHHALSLHFLYPWSTSSDPDTDATVRFSLLYGRSGRVSALDIGGAATHLSGDMKGVQLTGGYAQVDGSLNGAALTLGLHNVKGDVRGLQWSGLANWTEGKVTGLQYAFLLNHSGESLRGVQIAGLLNQADQDGRWVQLASVGNVAVDSFKGVQLSAIVNHSNGTMTGMQSSIMNYADEIHGLQLGVMNIGRTTRGVQIGVVNKSYDFEGLPLGLVNLSETSELNWMVSASNHATATLGFRTVLNGWSSIISAGYGDQLGDVKESLFLGWHFGHRLLTRTNWRLTADIGFTHIVPKTSDDSDVNDANHLAGQLRLHGEYRLGKTTALFAGVGTNNITDSYDDGAESTDETLFFGGLTVGGWR